GCRERPAPAVRDGLRPPAEPQPVPGPGLPRRRPVPPRSAVPDVMASCGLLEGAVAQGDPGGMGGAGGAVDGGPADWDHVVELACPLPIWRTIAMAVLTGMAKPVLLDRPGLPGSRWERFRWLASETRVSYSPLTLTICRSVCRTSTRSAASAMTTS